MQTLIDIHCSPGPSLREKIAKDAKLADYRLKVLKEQKPGRSPGWLKLKSTESNCPGAINVQWQQSRALRCRVINRAGGRPDAIVGDLVSYLLARHRKRLRAVLVLPG
jgi:hypothetical protein